MIEAGLLLLLQGAVYALAAPGAVGLLRWFKARLQGRRGPDPWQPYRDLARLFRKAPYVPEPASLVFTLAPPVIFTSYLLLGLFLPVFTSREGSAIDLVLVIYLLGLARFAGGLASFDAAAPFGPMSSGRQFFIHTLAEPAFLAGAYALALARQTTDLDFLVNPGAPPAEGGLPAVVLVVGAFALVALAESGRLPFDNPATHLELTMIERGSALGYGGRPLALLEWAEAMKLTFFLSLVGQLAFPFGIAADASLAALALAGAAHLVRLVALLFVLSAWELLRAKSRLPAVIHPLMMALGLALFAVVYTVATGYLFTE